jgi:hypothetical protein
MSRFIDQIYSPQTRLSKRIFLAPAKVRFAGDWGDTSGKKDVYPLRAKPKPQGARLDWSTPRRNDGHNLP